MIFATVWYTYNIFTTIWVFKAVGYSLQLVIHHSVIFITMMYSPQWCIHFRVASTILWVFITVNSQHCNMFIQWRASLINPNFTQPYLLHMAKVILPIYLDRGLWIWTDSVARQACEMRLSELLRKYRFTITYLKNLWPENVLFQNFSNFGMIA